MKLRGYSLLVLFLLAVSMVSAQPKVYLDSGALSTGSSEFSTFSSSSIGSDSEYKILQFRSSTTQDYRNRLEQEGVKFESYIPENAWLVKLEGVKKGDIIRRDKVWFLGPYRPSYKIASSIKKIKSGVSMNITVSMFEDIDKEFKEVLSRYSRINREISDKDIEVNTEASNFSKISRLENVKFISPSSGRPQTTNDDSRKLIDAERLQVSPFNLEGDGFTAGVWDAGWAGNHSDLNYTGKRVIGDKGDSCGSCSVDDHGTHVAGTLLGGGKIDNTYRGIAPETRLATYEWPTSGSSELYEETNDSIVKYDSIVSQNSWGFGYSECDPNQDFVYGDYDSWSRYYDKVVHGDTNEVEGTLSVVFSAGNERNNNCGTYNTTNYPSTAKNVITVGAVDSNADMTSFSSWGPTDDGRIKPDIVAHGFSVRSTEPGNIYGWKSGTSMAAPAISGAVVLLNQQFNRSYGKKPAPATVKGLLIHNSEDLNRTGPDYITGWGLANVTESVNYVENSYTEGLIRRKSIKQDQNHTYDINISTGDSANFTLVWSDHPASSGASETLVNDLDLVIRNSTGHRYYPWTLNWSIRKQKAVRTKPDRTNNLEQVYIPNVTSENLTITVNGTSVPQGPQSYTLLMSEKTRIVPELEAESPMNTSYPLSPIFNFTSSNPLLSASFSIDSGRNRSLANTSSKIFYNKTANISEGRHNVTFWAEYSQGNWTSTTEYFTTDYTKPDITPINPVNGTNLSGMENVSALWGDSLSGVENVGAIFENSTFDDGDDLNYSYDFSKLEDGAYNFTFIATDYVNNVRRTLVTTSIDNNPPELTSNSPAIPPGGGSVALRDNFTVNASYRDSGTAVKTAQYWLANSTGVQRTGEFNDTVNSSKYANGDYNLSFRLKDYEDNLGEKNISVTIDNSRPELDVLNPLNDTYVGPGFWINASANGTYSDLFETGFNVTNSTFSEVGTFNSTLETAEVSEGEYNVTFTAEDLAGNKISKRVNVTLDKTRPSLNLTMPEDSDIETGKFTVNATFNDSMAGIGSAMYYVRNSSGVQLNGTLNGTVNSSKLEDGSYTVEAQVNDTAGNLATEEAEIEVDNTAPELEFSTVNTGDNLTGNYEIDVEVSDVAGLDTGLFKWYNSSGNVTDWINVNTTFDFETLQTGEYNLSYRFNDTLGFTSIYNKTNITVDNTMPEISLEEYITTEEHEGWIKDNVTVETTCTDTGSGFKSASVYGVNSSTVTPVNFTVSESGNSSYSFECMDYAGNTVLEERRFSLDTEAPEVTSVTPDQDFNTNRNVTIIGEFNDEASESGLNVTASNLQASEGDIVYTQWSNDSFTAEVTNLSYSTDFTLSGDIVDNVGHSYSVDLSYSTRSEPQESTSSPSLPAGSTNTTSNETEAETVEAVFETLENGLSVSNLNLSEGEVRTVDVSNYSSGTVSQINLRGSASGPVGLEVSGLDSSDFSVPSGIEAERFVRMSVVNSSRVDNITVEFEITSSWLDSVGLSAGSVALFRVGSNWERIDTSLVDDGDVIRYRSELDEFSNFSVAAEKACRGENVYAVDPEGQMCRQYSSACEKPGTWNEVDSCQSWNDRKEVERVIQNLTEKGVSEQEIEGVREEYREGNYSGALELANQLENQPNEGGGLLMPILGFLVFLVLLAGGGYGGYIYYNRMQIEQEIEDLGEELINQADKGEINSHQEAVDKIIHAKQALDMNDYDKAESYLEDYRERAKREGLPRE